MKGYKCYDSIKKSYAFIEMLHFLKMNHILRKKEAIHQTQTNNQNNNVVILR